MGLVLNGALIYYCLCHFRELFTQKGKDFTNMEFFILHCYTGLLVTLWAIDRLGRRKTMALCFFIFSMCIIPLYGCVGR